MKKTTQTALLVRLESVCTQVEMLVDYFDQHATELDGQRHIADYVFESVLQVKEIIKIQGRA